MIQPRGRLRCCVSGHPSGRLRFRPLAALRSNGLAATLLIDQFGQRSFVMVLKFFGLECGGFLIDDMLGEIKHILFLHLECRQNTRPPIGPHRGSGAGYPSVRS